MKLDELSELFEQAIKIDDQAERQQFVESSCEDCVDRQKLEELVQAHMTTCELVDSKDSVANAVKTFRDDDSTPREGDQLGNYRLLQEIGEGGMGLVFMADQLQPIRRRVAVKIIKSEASSRHILARFEAEREALARLDHPNITRILDAGVTATGLPFFVMELVRGDSLIDYCDNNKLDIRQRIQLLEKVCLAVHHAHQKGILHRDIKPTNIMVTIHDSNPVPKVIDFGIAKALDQPLTQRTLFTRYGDMVGTPQYMSPEQAEKSGLDIDLRTDVFSLGVVLYQLLTGTTPIEEAALQDKGILGILETVRDCDTESPSFRVTRTLSLDENIATHRNTNGNLLQRSISGELDWITLKALSKDRSLRYESAAAMARDLRRYLNGDSIEAAAPTFFYLVRKAYQRHRTICLSIITCAALLIAVSLVSMSWAVSNHHLRELATKAASELSEKSDRLEKLNMELKRARDQAREAESRALRLANDKKKKLVYERAVSRLALQSVGLEIIGPGDIQILDSSPLNERLSSIIEAAVNNTDVKQPGAVMISPGIQAIRSPEVSIQVVGGHVSKIEDLNELAALPGFARSNERQSEFYSLLLAEYRDEFGTSHPLVAACLIDSCDIELKHKTVNWSLIESRCREAKAIFHAATGESMSQTELLFAQLKTEAFLARAMVGQNRESESSQLTKAVNVAIADQSNQLTVEQRRHLQTLISHSPPAEK